jgi:two-component system NtrC family sensor kinase
MAWLGVGRSGLEPAGPNDLRTAAQQRRDQLATLGELTAGVAHELNNSIGFVASNLHSLERFTTHLAELVTLADGMIPEEHRVEWSQHLARARWTFLQGDLPSLLEDTRSGADHLVQILGDLKTLARSSQRPESASLNDCVASALGIVAHRARIRGTTMESQLNAGRRRRLLRPQVMQLGINLVLNALEAAPVSGGRVRITTVDTADEGQLIVEDNGPGVPSAERERIFQAHSSSKSQGCGFGLTIARQVVRAHGGCIAVDTSPELGGARFTATLVGNDDERACTTPS